MVKLILKSPYIKSRGGAGGYLKYIATRERVEIIPDDRPPTRKQEQLIAKLTKDFPDSKTLYEYEDYIAKPTKANASAFITLALESNWESVQRSEQYAKYIATRPRTERIGTHGLFGDEDGVDLDKAMSELENYGATIVTNGYLLNCAVVEKLNTLYVNQYQVTLDGRKEIHDCSRPLANGGGTYDVITQNLIDVKDVIPSVSLRINTGRHNVDQVHEIFEWVKDNGLSEKVFPYLGKITSTGKEDPTTSMCLNTDEFVEARIKMINGETANLQRNNFYPTPVRCYCGADSNNVFVIDSDGSLYKCWDDIGHIERAVGNINTNIEYNSTLFSYIQYSAVDDPDCSDCAVLPICMGGCPHRRVQSLPDRCSEFKDHLEEFLLITADNVIKARSKENENVQAV